MPTGGRKLKPAEYQGSKTSVDDSRVLLTGANFSMRLSEADDDSNSSEVSFWRIVFSPAGPGHALYLKSELTEGRWNIYSDNIGMARWMQRTIQGMLIPDSNDPSISVIVGMFNESGDPRDFLTETVKATGVEISMTWSEFGEPILLHSRPGEPPSQRPYGVCAVLSPALAARVTINGMQAKGRAWPRDRMGRPYSTCVVGFSESWTEPR